MRVAGLGANGDGGTAGQGGHGHPHPGPAQRPAPRRGGGTGGAPDQRGLPAAGVQRARLGDGHLPGGRSRPGAPVEAG